MTRCPACHGEGIREWRAYTAGVSPFDQSVKCDLCLGLCKVQARLAEQWRRFPTIPPMPERRWAA